MIDTTSQRPSLGTRRRRLAAARQFDAAARAHLHATLARGGFHGLMVAVGLVAAVTVWNRATERFQLAETGPEMAASLNAMADDVVDVSTDAAGETVTLPDTTGTVAVANGTPMQPLKRTVVEGDTIRSIAAEYSVSMSTILAS